jgi:hypothetical protein
LPPQIPLLEILEGSRARFDAEAFCQHPPALSPMMIVFAYNDLDRLVDLPCQPEADGGVGRVVDRAKNEVDLGAGSPEMSP